MRRRDHVETEPSYVGCRVKRRLSTIWGSPLVRRIVGVAGGNSIAQIVVLLFAPVITRIFSPEVFGLQGVFLAAISLLSPIIALRYPMAIVLAKHDSEVRQVIRLSFATMLIMCVIFTVVILLFQDQVASLLGIEQLGTLIYLLPVGLALVAYKDIADFRAARANEFRAVSVITAIQAIIVNSTRAIGGIFAPVSATLIIISTAGPGLYALMLTFVTRKHSRLEQKPSTEVRLSLMQLARKYRDFPILRMPTDFVNAAAQTVPVILFAALFSPAVAGLYTLARSVVNVPSNVVGNAIGNVYYAHFAELRRHHKRISGVALKATIALFVGPGLLVVCVCFFAPTLFAFAFGEDWREAGVYAQWMSLWIAAALANVPSVRLAPVIGRQGSLLAANCIMLALRLGAILFAYVTFESSLAAVAAYSVVSAVANLGLIGWMLWLTRTDDGRHVASPTGGASRPEDEGNDD